MVMPNLVPPITAAKQAINYRTKLQALEPNVHFLMSLYLNSGMTCETIQEAKDAGITNIKSYPAGVTTNSSSGVVDYKKFYPLFEKMEQLDMILNIHGESPSKGAITVLNAEENFLPTLTELHERFPKLRIIMEHCTTAAAIETVKSLGRTVAATITAHHLSIIVDDWAGDPFCFCKPVAKLPADRDALLQAAVSDNPKFFFGSDSAPHPSEAKRGGDKISAGVFTQPYATQLVLDAVSEACENGVLNENFVSPEILEGFLSDHGRDFYGLSPESCEFIELHKNNGQISDVLRADQAGIEVVPFRKGRTTWSLSWS